MEPSEKTTSGLVNVRAKVLKYLFGVVSFFNLKRVTFTRQFNLKMNFFPDVLRSNFLFSDFCQFGAASDWPSSGNKPCSMRNGITRLLRLLRCLYCRFCTFFAYHVCVDLFAFLFLFYFIVNRTFFKNEYFRLMNFTIKYVERY